MIGQYIKKINMRYLLNISRPVSLNQLDDQVLKNPYQC